MSGELLNDAGIWIYFMHTVWAGFIPVFYIFGQFPSFFISHKYQVWKSSFDAEIKPPAMT